MSAEPYSDPVEVLTDEDSVAHESVCQHTRYVEEAYCLPEKRSAVLALAQFGATPSTISAVLDVGERTVHKHWTLLHRKGANPEHYGDIFGSLTPAFNEVGSTDGIWLWPWTHIVSIDYDNPNTGTTSRLSAYYDPYLSAFGSTEYLVVQDTIRDQCGRELVDRERRVYAGGEMLARHLSLEAETPLDYRAIGVLIELVKGDANGQVRPDDVFGIGYDELPRVSGTVRGRAADVVNLFRDNIAENLTTDTGHIDWGYVSNDDDDIGVFDTVEVRRTDSGLVLR